MFVQLTQFIEININTLVVIEGNPSNIQGNPLNKYRIFLSNGFIYDINETQYQRILHTQSSKR